MLEEFGDDAVILPLLEDKIIVKCHSSQNSYKIFGTFLNKGVLTFKV